MFRGQEVLVIQTSVLKTGNVEKKIGSKNNKMAGRLAGDQDQSLIYRGGKDRLYPKSPADINYGLAENQEELTWDRFRPLGQVNSPAVNRYEFKIDKDLNRQSVQDYKNQVRFGGIQSIRSVGG